MKIFSLTATACAVVLAAASIHSLQAQTAPPPPQQSAQPVPVPGTADAGRAAWANRSRNRCADCHGANGEGGFGPDLAGRGLSVDQFKRAVRTPWGIMPAFTERQLNDQNLTGMALWFASLPETSNVGSWHVTVPPNAPPAQTAMIGIGCGQCHEEDMGIVRMMAGGAGADYDWFVKRVYMHTDFYSTGAMGNYSPVRVPEATLRGIWQFISQDLGLRALVRTAVSAGSAEGGNTTYTVTLTNAGAAGKGLAAENLTLSVDIPAGASVVKATGDGYRGVRQSAQGTAAEWTMPRLAAGEKAVYTIALAGSTTTPTGLVKWTKPTVDEARVPLPQPGPPPPGQP